MPQSQPLPASAIVAQGRTLSRELAINFRNFTEIIGKILLGISNLGFQARFHHLCSRFHPCCGPLKSLVASKDCSVKRTS